MADLILALKVNEKDNVATVFSNGAEKAAAVTVKDEKGKEKEIVIFEDIPYGHKLAIRDIAKGELIIKYGEEIGIAVADIKKEIMCMYTTWNQCAAEATGRERNEI